MGCLHLPLFATRDPCSRVPWVWLRSLLANYRLLTTTFPDASQVQGIHLFFASYQAACCPVSGTKKPQIFSILQSIPTKTELLLETWAVMPKKTEGPDRGARRHVLDLGWIGTVRLALEIETLVYSLQSKHLLHTSWPPDLEPKLKCSSQRQHRPQYL